MRLVDLSFPITPHFRWKAESERPATHAAGDPLQSTIMTLSCHAYTHVDAPLHYQPDPTCNPSDPNCAWDVQTYDHSYLGATSIENATVHSDNTVFARLILDVGPDKVVKMAYKLGIRSSTLDAVPSLTLGSIGVSPLEMASVYSTLAAGRYFNSILMFEPLGPGGRSVLGFRAQVYVDISEFIEQKMDAIKAHECRVFAQLNHRGALLRRSVLNMEPVGPSTWKNPNTGDVVRPLTVPEIVV